MEEKVPDHIPKPGVPEALDPTLGNGALWESSPHLFCLETVDPSKQLDNILLDDSIKQKVLNQWRNSTKTSLSAFEPPQDPDSDLFDSNLENETSDQRGKLIITRNQVKKTVEVDWEENIMTPGDEAGDPPSDSTMIVGQESPLIALGEDAEVPSSDLVEPVSKPSKPGKRVRKVARKAHQQEESKQDLPTLNLPKPAEDETLSPFTRWLKGLRGSEYVHPYEDDYGLDQMSVTSRGGVSETFADLLASQGHLDKAVSMYMQLMEKYPEKSSFFAAKIEALK